MWMNSLLSCAAGLLRPGPLWQGAVGEVVVGHAVEQAVEEVGWVGLVGRSQGAGETRSSLQGEFPSMTATVDVVEMVIWLV